MVCDPAAKAASECTLKTTREVLLLQVSHPLWFQSADKGWSPDNWAYMSKTLDVGTLKQFKASERRRQSEAEPASVNAHEFSSDALFLICPQRLLSFLLLL